MSGIFSIYFGCKLFINSIRIYVDMYVQMLYVCSICYIRAALSKLRIFCDHNFIKYISLSKFLINCVSCTKTFIVIWNKSILLQIYIRYSKIVSCKQFINISTTRHFHQSGWFSCDLVAQSGQVTVVGPISREQSSADLFISSTPCNAHSKCPG